MRFMNMRCFKVKLLDRAKFIMEQDHNVSRPLLTEGNACYIDFMWSLHRISVHVPFPFLLPDFPHCCLSRKAVMTTLLETVTSLSYSLAQLLALFFSFHFLMYYPVYLDFLSASYSLLEYKLHEKRRYHLWSLTEFYDKGHKGKELCLL